MRALNKAAETHRPLYFILLAKTGLLAGFLNMSIGKIGSIPGFKSNSHEFFYTHIMRKLLIILMALSFQAWSQGIQLKGRVTTDSTSEPLPGVSVFLEKSPSVGSITDGNGDFVLDIGSRKRPTLVFSAVGFNPKLVQIGDETFLNIVLEKADNQLNEILVRGLTAEEADAREVRMNVNPVTVITAREIENRASNLNELLSRQAGVQIRQSGGAGSSSTISVRGLEGKRVQVYLDGNPLNTPDGSFGINDLPLQIIERVEIYKGTVPAELGGDGLGSAVNVIIKHRDYSYIDANIAVQSFGTVNGGLIIKKSMEKRGIEAGVGAFLNQSQNNYLMQSPFQPDLKIRRDHDFYRNVLLGGGITFHKLWFDEVEFEGAYVDYFRELQGIQRNIQEIETTSKLRVIVNNLEKSEFLLNNLGFRSHTVMGSINATLIDTSSYAYNWDGTRIPSLIGRGELGVGPNDLQTRQFEFRNRTNLKYIFNPKLSLNLNNSYRRGFFKPKDDLANEYAGGNVYNWPADLSNNVLGLTLEAKSPGGRFMGAVSMKHYTSRVNGYNTNIYLRDEPETINASYSKLGYNLGIRYNLGKDFIFKTSHERALRLPNNQELFGDGLLITPSLSLRPEVAYNYTLGLVLDKFQYPSGNRFQIEWNAFLMNVSDLIQLGGNGLTTGYVNYAKARITGADIEVKKDITAYLFGSINATWQRVTDINRIVPGTDGVPNPTYGLVIPNIPLIFGNWNLEFHKRKLLGGHSKTRMIYEGSYTKEFNFGFAISQFDNLQIPSFLTHNLIWEQAFKDDRWIITGEVRNLTNALVLNNWNQPLPGRSFRLKLRYLLIDK